MRMVTVGEALAALPELLDRVSAGEELTISRDGEPVAVVIRPDVLRARRVDEACAAAYQLHSLLADSRAARLSANPAMSEARAESLLAELRGARSDPRTG
jgi:antitoxin (DNA-binding transcriptional repressor) of toxin-antitoxin stability system